MTVPIPNPVSQALMIAKIMVAAIILCVIGYMGYRIKSLFWAKLKQSKKYMDLPLATSES